MKMFDYSKLDSTEALEYIFHPFQTVKTKSVQGSVDVEFNVEEDVVISCRFHLADKDAPVILYFHGNG